MKQITKSEAKHPVVAEETEGSAQETAATESKPEAEVAANAS